MPVKKRKNKWRNQWNETARYRQEGEPTNSKCGSCKTAIWQRISLGHTVSHGHGYYSNSLEKKEPESVVVWDGKSRFMSAVCYPCFLKIEAGETPMPVSKKRKNKLEKVLKFVNDHALFTFKDFQNNFSTYPSTEFTYLNLLLHAKYVNRYARGKYEVVATPSEMLSYKQLKNEASLKWRD